MILETNFGLALISQVWFINVICLERGLGCKEVPEQCRLKTDRCALGSALTVVLPSERLKLS